MSISLGPRHLLTITPIAIQTIVRKSDCHEMQRPHLHHEAVRVYGLLAVHSAVQDLASAGCAADYGNAHQAARDSKI